MAEPPPVLVGSTPYSGAPAPLLSLGSVLFSDARDLSAPPFRLDTLWKGGEALIAKADAQTRETRRRRAHRALPLS